MLNSVVAASIEVLSLLIAESVGVPMLFHAHASSDFVLVYAFGIACGGLGSRLSAMWRERVKGQLPIAVRRAA
jgi:hypothetical protein